MRRAARQAQQLRAQLHAETATNQRSPAGHLSPSNDYQEVIMNRTRRLSTIRRLTCALAGLAATLLAVTAAAPAALARPVPLARGWPPSSHPLLGSNHHPASPGHLPRSPARSPGLPHPGPDAIATRCDLPARETPAGQASHHCNRRTVARTGQSARNNIMVLSRI
jgi:hypothetical protein